MAKQKRRPLAVFLMRNFGKIGDFIFKMKGINTNITTDPNGYFTAPSPTPVAVKTDIDALVSAETDVQSHAPGSTGVRDIAYDKVILDKNLWQSYVQGLADKAPDEPTAIAIIQASGYYVRMNGVYIKPKLAAKNGPVSGSVKLTAQSAGRASYEWQVSTDNGTTWTNLPPSLQAKTIAYGLAIGQPHAFRFRSVTKTGPGNWSDAIVWVVQ
jgi:hypothetical protein